MRPVVPGVLVAALLGAATVSASGPDSGGCPYDFDSDMPSGVFCVYKGVALSPDGTPCAGEVVALWSGGATAGAGNDVHIGFVAEPELVVRATVAGQGRDHAELVEYYLGDDHEPLVGSAELRPLAGKDSALLTIALQSGDAVDGERCRFTTYRGTYIGLIGDAAPSACAQR